jgi:hypothetical protein
MARDAIVALGILKANWEREQRDYLENLVPIVVEALRTTADDAVSLPQLRAHIANRFGLDIPLNPLKAILQRAHKAGYLRREHGVFFRDLTALSATTFFELEARVSRIHDAVVNSLRGYARTKFQLSWSDADAEEALLAFLAADDTTLLLSSFDGRSFEAARESKSTAYVVSSFIYHAQAQDPGLFDGLETLAKGHMLATALFLADPGRIEQKFKNTTIYFDSRFLIYASGYAGPDREAPAKELLALLHNFDAHLACFEHTLDEMRGILDANAAVIRRGRPAAAYGETIEYFLQQGYTSSDIDLLSARLPEKLKFLRVHLESKPAYEAEHVIDEDAFQQELDRKIGYRNKDALLHDVNCISAIARLRRRHRAHAVETCRALFVTTNSELVRATRAFLQPDSEAGEVPLALTDHTVGNLMWVKNPIGAPNLPRKLLIADAYAAMQPSEDVWKTYLAEISRLEKSGEITHDDYYLLRYSTTAKKAVMDIVLGGEEAFTEGSVAEVLEIAHQHIRAGLEEQVRSEAAQRTALQKQLTVKEQQLQLLGEAHTAQLNQIRARELLKEQIQRDRLGLTARSIARYVMYVPRTIGFGALVVGTLLTFPRDFPALSESWVRYFAAGTLGAIFLINVAGGAWGFTLNSLFNRLEKRLAEFLERKLVWLQAPLDYPDTPKE